MATAGSLYARSMAFEKLDNVDDGGLYMQSGGCRHIKDTFDALLTRGVD